MENTLSTPVTCGAGTNTCQCGHLRRDHVKDAQRHIRGCRTCACTQFAGRPCDKPPTTGKARCDMHGGKSLGGAAHPNFGKGYYSNVLPRRVVQDYENVLKDDGLLSLRHQIAVLKAMDLDIWRRVKDLAAGSKEAQRAFVQLTRAWDLYTRAEGATARTTARERVDRFMGELEEAMAEAKGESMARAESRDNMVVLERLERSENTRMVELYNMISAERALALRSAETTIFIEAVEALVPDREVVAAIRRRVAMEFAKLTGRDTEPVALPPTGTEG